MQGTSLSRRTAFVILALAVALAFQTARALPQEQVSTSSQGQSSKTAIDDLKQAVARTPQDPNLRLELADAYLSQDLVKDALPHLEAAYSLGLCHVGVTIPLAVARFSVGEDDRAVEILQS